MSVFLAQPLRYEETALLEKAFTGWAKAFRIHNQDTQEATPMAPARAVSTAMRILRICFQSGFMLF